MDFTLYLLVSGTEGLEEALKAGVDLVQLRAKELDDRKLMELAEEVKAIADRHHVPLIINDRPDICMAIDADGVHLGQTDMPVDTARKILGPERIIGVSTHSVGQARAAMATTADYLAIGPVFGTLSKDPPMDPIGLDAVREIASFIDRPWVAIGGINRGNISRVKDAGATRFAMISGILDGNITENVRALLDCSLL